MAHMNCSQMLKTNILRCCHCNIHHDDNHEELNAAGNQPPRQCTSTKPTTTEGGAHPTSKKVNGVWRKGKKRNEEEEVKKGKVWINENMLGVEEIGLVQEE